MTTTDYLFDTGSDLGRRHMDCQQHLLDPTTMQFLEPTGIGPGARCLDLGAGGGSISRWMAERAGPSGLVVSVDLETSYLEAGPGIEVHRHDINDGLPVDGPYDLIHARALLMHLPRREEILRMLVDALAPGGWLVVSDPGPRPLTPLAAPNPEDLEVWSRIDRIGHGVLSPAVGQSLAWAEQAYEKLTDVGLEDVTSAEYSTTSAGGEAGCLLLHALIGQISTALVQHGVTESEVRRGQELLLDPCFQVWFYRYIFTRGQRKV